MTPDPRLLDLLQSYEERRARGEEVAPEELCRDCPELLGDLRRQLGRLGGVAVLPEDAERRAEAPAPAQIGGYEILWELGRGGMGVVYQARCSVSRRTVAVKLLRGDVLDGPQALARFRREAEALSRLSHPNIVQLIEAGQHEGRPYLVMELVAGGGLDLQLKGEPQPFGASAARIETLARAVHAAHQAGIIHRDLKPSNVLVAEDGELKVTDFGLAKQLDADTKQTSTGAVLGTPSYMSPEQAAGRVREVGPATDVWALGVLLYEMLTGKLPFIGASVLDTLDKVHNADPEPPSQLRPDVPLNLETICLKCLHKDPGKRYATAEALADDLKRYQETGPVHGKRPGPGLGKRLGQWRRNHPVATALLILVPILLALAAGGLWYWDAYYREHVEYYANAVNRRGVWEGVGRLSEAEARGRGLSFEFHRRGGRVERVELVNGSGERTGRHGVESLFEPRRAEAGATPAGEECRFEYQRNQQGEVLEEKAFDRFGNVRWVLHYTSPTTAQYTLPPASDHPGGPGPDPRRPAPGVAVARTRSGVVYLKFDWGPDGLEEALHYLDREGRLTPDDWGVYGVRFERDARGLPVRATFLGADGQPTLHPRHRAATIALDYDARGELIRLAYFGVKGDKVLNQEGVHEVKFERDDRGNLAAGACFDAEGRRCTSLERYHKFTVACDERGNEVEAAFWGEDRRACRHQDGYHRCTTRYDGRGNPTERAYFGTDDRPCPREGAHKIAWEYDDRGCVVQAAGFGADGAPCEQDGVHEIRLVCDERGRAVETAYFDAQARPCARPGGPHRLKARYDDLGNVVEQAYFDADGRRWTSPDGYHRRTARYDPRGDQTEGAYFGADGEPCLHKAGYHRYTEERKEHGDESEEAYFDVQGRPCLNEEQYHRAVRRFDRQGNLVAFACFDADRKPCLHRDGYHELKAWYDGQGRVTRQEYFDVKGQPCLHKDGCFRFKVAYRRQGREVEYAYFGLDEKPCLNADGCHKGVWRYDERGRQVEFACYDVAGKPCLYKGAYHKRLDTYDERGNQLEPILLDAEERPVMK